MPKAGLKRVYSLVPFKRELFALLKAVYRPSERVYRHLHFIGPFQVKVEEGREFSMFAHGYMEENEVFWNGLDNGWERKSIKIWRELCRDASVVFDVGANTGLYTLVPGR